MVRRESRKPHHLRRAGSAALLASVVLAASCGMDEPHEAAAPQCMAGDPSQPLEFDIVYRSTEGVLMPCSHMEPVPLMAAPQGGRIMLVGVRATNLKGCHVNVSSALVDTETNAVISLERRPVTLEMAADGMLTPVRPESLSNYSNLPGCPRAAITRSVSGLPYTLRMTVEDGSGRSAEKSVLVVPTCAAGTSEGICKCECAVDYKQGAACLTAAGGASGTDEGGWAGEGGGGGGKP